MSLQPSMLSDQAETLKNDLDLKSLDLAVQGKTSLPILKNVTGVAITRTIEGASSLVVTARDRERLIWTSGYIAGQVDTQIDGLWFRLKGYDKQGDDLTLTFEDREVALLRDYPKPDDPHRYLVRSAQTTTRLQFAKLLVDEVKDVPIRFVTPDSFPALLQDSTLPLTKVAKTHARGLGFAPGAAITVKGRVASPAQRDVIDRVLQVGVSQKARRKVLVTAVMTITQESSATNLPGGDRDSKGAFQQRASQGWPASGVVEVDAAAFFEAAISDDKKNPGLQDWQLAQDVQLSENGQLYAQWKTEAERTVDAWGVTGDTPTPGSSLPASADKSFQFTRGTITYQGGKKLFTREDNWSCLQRLASEVNWRCFCVSGTIYFMPDLDLLASQPQMTLSETSDGVDTIDGNGDEGRQSIRKGHRVQQLNQQATIPCRIGRWQAPPGTCVELEDTGPLDGRWLVATIERASIFKPDATITLKRPQAALPEAKAPEYLDTSGGQLYVPPTSSAVTPGGQFVAAGSLVQPVPKEFSRGHGGIHQTEGLPGYPALDFFASPGSPVVAPESGKIVRFSGHDPALGPIGAPGGPLGWTIYLLGDSGTEYFITHLATRTVTVGQKVGIATEIGTVADYDTWGRASHTHVGVHGGPVSIEMLGAAPLAEKAVVNPADALHHR